MKTKHKTKIARLIKPRIKSDACITTVFKVSKKFELKLENNEFEKKKYTKICCKCLGLISLIEKSQQQQKSNTKIWTNSMVWENRLRWLTKFWNAQKKIFWKIGNKNRKKFGNSGIREFGNLEIRKIRKRIRKIGNSETNSGNWKSGNEFGNWTDFEKMFGKSDLIAQAWNA